ncbi:hypothetical protein A3F06_02995 [candidate division TM6 bacterium RIFCSPHIGHO2_12_FULL_36_22]|nr:MAG: hypothetical protein A3F06_02995 [candidate division TM6 bacterium RIFCSPHIGHO2_12_FULL_36_22]
MKSYLLDTHIILWWLSNDKKLSKKAKELIEDPNNHIVVSAVTIWEISIKKSLNKLEAPNNIIEELEKNSIDQLPMTCAHAQFVEQLPNIHQDPFDRLLISQVLVENMVFVTADKVIPKYPVHIF